MKRAIRVNVNGVYSHTIGGNKAGQYSSGYTNKKPVKRIVGRNRRTNYIALALKVIAFLIFTKKGLKITGTLIFVSWFLSTITISTKPFKAEAKGESCPAELPLNGATSYESKDMPAFTDYFDKYFGSKADEARKVAKCEANRPVKSKMNKNGTYDYGHMQINTIWLKYFGLTEEQALDPETNISTSKKIYDRTNDFSAWKYSYKCHGIK